MNIRLHKNATTTPKIRQEIRQSSLSPSQLAKRYGVTIPTIQRWRNSDSVEDR
ncbi:MAG TPA: IS481 family transposase, partial [Gammaproteobacteria bacterium]|nr:IS481 family transposase [Gammaproteobacteria bacterium]